MAKHNVRNRFDMNIFCLDNNPIQAARWCMDKHVVKMPTESAQMLTNCFSAERLSRNDCPRTMMGTIRKYSHYNHPCSIWVRKSKDNMVWLIEHSLELCNEKLRRYPDKKDHFARTFLNWAKLNIEDALVEADNQLYNFPLAIADNCKCRTVKGFSILPRIEQYRLYYIHDKQHIAHWKLNKPDWFNFI